MYDYLCDTLFQIPMCPVGPDAWQNTFQRETSRKQRPVVSRSNFWSKEIMFAAATWTFRFARNKHEQVSSTCWFFACIFPWENCKFYGAISSWYYPIFCMLTPQITFYFQQPLLPPCVQDLHRFGLQCEHSTIAMCRSARHPTHAPFSAESTWCSYLVLKRQQICNILQLQ